MKELNLENIGCSEISKKEAVQTNGGIIIELMLAFGIGYFLGRWAGGKPVWD
jgi:hypothetical protein